MELIFGYNKVLLGNFNLLLHVFIVLDQEQASELQNGKIYVL